MTRPAGLDRYRERACMCTCIELGSCHQQSLSTNRRLLAAAYTVHCAAVNVGVPLRTYVLQLSIYLSRCMAYSNIHVRRRRALATAYRVDTTGVGAGGVFGEPPRVHHGALPGVPVVCPPGRFVRRYGTIMQIDITYTHVHLLMISRRTEIDREQGWLLLCRQV
jgi:hypothetical protein